MILEEFDEEKTAVINPQDLFSEIEGKQYLVFLA